MAVTRLLLMLVLACNASGCATVFKGSDRSVIVESDPPGAQVVVDGVSQDSTPTSVRLRSNQNHRIVVSMPGYQEESVLVRSNVNAAWVIADGLCLWIPAIVDGITGAWNDLDRTKIRATLTPEEAAEEDMGHASP